MVEKCYTVNAKRFDFVTDRVEDESQYRKIFFFSYLYGSIIRRYYQNVKVLVRYYPETDEIELINNNETPCILYSGDPLGLSTFIGKEFNNVASPLRLYHKCYIVGRNELVKENETEVPSLKGIISNTQLKRQRKRRF